MQSFRCPDCGQESRDPGLAATGFCPGCGRYTGLCDAGRRFYYRGWVHGGNWQVPCEHPWAGEWEILFRRGGTRRGRLCEAHGVAVGSGTAPVRGARLAGSRAAPPAHRRPGGVRRALRMVFSPVVPPAWMAENRARYLARQKARQRARL